MRASFAIFAAVAAFGNFATADTPPACLLAALGVQDNPSDIKAVCGDLQSAVQGNLTENCNKSILPEAHKAYASKCKEAGVTVSDLPSSTSSSGGSSKTSSPSGTSSGSGSGSASATPTDGASGTSGSDTGSATASSSNAAATDSAGQAAEPQRFLYAAAALLATGFTSVIFL
ncbi:hypothetical protein F4779DRAFT_564546 [Xylariaceae sp. FL0662B]|nr:hypothetical protein F4779DRAFT_564546 [Xylariaceae sp. FL0662B]